MNLKGWSVGTRARDRVLAAGLLGVLMCLGAQVPAIAHGEFESARPEPDSQVPRPPRSVSITLTEPPAPGTVVTVIDGCRRDLVTATRNSDAVVEAELKEGQPGKWTVRFRAVSAVDGHTTGDTYGFRVAGKKDCSKPKTDKSPKDRIAGGKDTQIASDDLEDEGTGFPIIPFAIGSVVVIAAAVLLRRATK